RSLERVLERVRQVIDEARNAVKGLRSRESGGPDLAKSLAQIRHEFEISDEIEFRLIVDGEVRSLRPLARDEIYKIGREAVVNAIRHSQANEIGIELKYGPRQLRLVIRDNGRGMDQTVLQSGRDGHWGLPGM